jgi:hypothetical protein
LGGVLKRDDTHFKIKRFIIITQTNSIGFAVKRCGLKVHEPISHNDMDPNSRGEWEYFSRDELFMFRVLCWEQHQILNLDMWITRAYHEIPPAKQVLLTGNVMIPDWMYVMLTRRYHSPKGELYIREWFSWSERLSACYDEHKEEECQLQKLDAEIQHAYHL